MKRAERNVTAQGDSASEHRLPKLLTSGEVAELLRTTRKAIYAMVERRQLPGIVRVGRRVLFEQHALVDWLRQKSSPSLER
jgi:excisionase family DNA binding protein